MVIKKQIFNQTTKEKTMKKLLTTMSAVAMAMSLFAADDGALSGTNFEVLDVGDAREDDLAKRGTRRVLRAVEVL